MNQLEHNSERQENQERLTQANEDPSSKLLPDFGTLAYQALGATPFRLRVFTQQNSLFAFSSHGTTIIVTIQGYHSNPLIIVTGATLLAIEIPSASEHQAQRVLDQLLDEGLTLQANPSRKYTTRDGVDVIPVTAAEELTEVDRSRITKAQTKRQKRASKAGRA